MTEEIQIEGDAIEKEIGNFLSGFMEEDGRLISVSVVHTADDELFPICSRAVGGDGAEPGPIRRMDDEERAWVLSLMREADLVACSMARRADGGFGLRMAKRMRPDREEAR